MSVTTPPHAPKKNRPGFLEPTATRKTAEQALDDMLTKAFPPGEFVPIPLAEGEFQRIMEESWKNLPVWFHFEKIDGVVRPRSFDDKVTLLASLEKI